MTLYELLEQQADYIQRKYGGTFLEALGTLECILTLIREEYEEQD